MGVNLGEWQSKMLSYGDIHAKKLISIQNDESKYDEALLACYYDAEWVYYKIADYTADAKWLEAAKAAHNIYATKYLVRNNGGVPGYWKFPYGIAERYKREKLLADKVIFNLLATNGAYSSDLTEMDYLRTTERSREAAYTIDTLIVQEKIFGGMHRKYLEAVVMAAVNHIYTWHKNPDEVCPTFMVALTCHSLISYEEYFPANFVYSTVELAANFIWDRVLVKGSDGSYTFKYANVPTSEYNTNPAPDLNQLIAPLYGYLFKKKENDYNLWRGNRIFNTGVSAGYLGNPKQFNQAYKLSFDYLKWTGQLR